MTDWIKPFEENFPSDTIISAVEGWRIWYLHPDKPWLHSFWHVQNPWYPFKRVEATCLNHMSCICSHSPEEKVVHNYMGTVMRIKLPSTCNAGVYAFKTQDQGFYCYMDQLENMVATVEAAREEGIITGDPRNRIAFGKVYLWGKVLECSKGFRGQFAYPSGIYNTGDNSPALAELYRVPLLALKDHRRDYPHR